MKSDSVQPALRLAFGVHHAATDAPRKLVLACMQFDEFALNKALAVAMKAGGHKGAYIAACVGCDESYVSLMRRCKRPITERLIGPLCAATGSNLLRQVAHAMEAMADDEEGRMAAMLRDAA